jgi:hypothetical protein
MRTFAFGLIFASLLNAVAAGREPLRLDPHNPHYLLFRGKPTILLGSSEHYGSVLNRDFDYQRYFNTIQVAGFNVTRIFTGTYHERPGKFAPGYDFEIAENSLAPRPESFLAPWPRTDHPGAVDGKNKFDLSRWNETYFRRLKDVVEAAGRRGIVVEVSLFCPYYADRFWEVSPLNAKNNINGIGDLARGDALSLKDSRMVAVQDAMVRKIVTELRDFDNVYYEICNECDFTDVPLDWQAHIAQGIADSESSFPTKHLIAQEFGKKMHNPVSQASLLTFHLSRPPDAATLSHQFDKPIGMNESGFEGITDSPYRIQSWEFFLAGGAIVDLLDYSFTVGHEDGTFHLPQGQPGGGSRELRHQLGILRLFMNGMDFLHMSPAPSVIKGGVPANASAYVLAEVGKSYAVYVDHAHPGSADSKRYYQVDSTPHQIGLTLDIPAGSYVARWVNTKTGAIAKEERFKCSGGTQTIQSPTYSEDIALRISRASGP